MADKHTYRPIPLALIALVALFSALATLAVSGGHDAQAHGHDHAKAGISVAAFGPASAGAGRRWAGTAQGERLAGARAVRAPPAFGALPGARRRRRRGPGRSAVYRPGFAGPAGSHPDP